MSFNIETSFTYEEYKIVYEKSLQPITVIRRGVSEKKNVATHVRYENKTWALCFTRSDKSKKKIQSTNVVANTV